jgi:predicted phosphodiesterase
MRDVGFTDAGLPMKLNILSDLHLSLGALEPPHNDADVVILAGDIARPRDAASWASSFTKPVLYVLGNHEFYGSSIVDTVDEAKRLCAGSRIHVLDNAEVIIDGVRFLGTTLWTDFLLFGDEEKRLNAIREAVSSMYDFTKIRTGNAGEQKFTPAHSAPLFIQNAEWLAAKLSKLYAGPTVVITHHAPSPKRIHPRFAGSLLNTCFVSDAERLVDGRLVRLWMHGHTHDSFDYVLNGTRVVCNPRGYAKDAVNEIACSMQIARSKSARNNPVLSQLRYACAYREQ